MKNLLPTLFISFIILIFSCKQKEAVVENKNEALPLDFHAFYERFSNDSVFQMQSIVFPLEGRPSLKDGMDSIHPNFKWQQENWTLHRPYNDVNGTFTRSYTVFNDIVSEDVRDDSGQFTMIRRFAKTSDGWKLIYYKEMGL